MSEAQEQRRECERNVAKTAKRERKREARRFSLLFVPSREMNWRKRVSPRMEKL